MTITPAEAAQELLNRRRARRMLAEYIAYTSKKYKRSKFSDLVCAAIDQFIEDVFAGKRPILVLQAPPQHGKSEIVSRKLPAYLMGKYPDLRIGAASYSDALAGTMAQDVRRNLASEEHRTLFPVEVGSRRYDVNRIGEFTTPGGEGSYLGVGVGAGLTGRPLDCLVAGTLIDTDHGKIPIEELKTLGETCKVLACINGGLTYERIKAFASGPGVGIYRITSERGRVLEVTANHRIHTTRGYVRASELAPGDVLLSAVRKIEDDQRSRLQEAKSQVLLSDLHVAGADARKKMCGLPLLNGAQRLREILRCLLVGKARHSENRSEIHAENGNLPNVSKRVYIRESKGRGLFKVLREAVRGSWACIADVRHSKPEVEAWSDPVKTAASFGKGVSDYSAWNFAARWLRMCSMQGWRKKAGGSPYRRGPIEQFIVEFGDSVRGMPQRSASSDGWETETDGVARIERVCEEATVFDIQVEKASNFFANGILVHNCGIIDDPVKNQQEALSPVTKEGHWSWYQSVFTTRLSENSGQIIMATSWAEDDLPGRILSHYAGDQRLKVLRFPAINSPDEAGYNPELPEGPLVPQLHSLEKLLETKALFSDYWWAALYQQAPKALGGNVFKESGVQYYLPKDLPPKFDKMLASWDCTFKDTDGTDYVVGQVWGKKGADSYLLAQVRERMSFTKTVEAVVKLRDEWPRAIEILIEDKANGPAVIDTLKSHVPGILPIEPDGSKLARAHAVTSYWEAKNVWIPSPEICPWIKGFVSELTAFPAAANDDQVDAMTQALRRLYPLMGRLNITAGALAQAMRRR